LKRALLLALAVLLAVLPALSAPAQAAGPTLVAWGGNGGTGNPLTATLSSPAPAGTLLVVMAWASWSESYRAITITPSGSVGNWSVADLYQHDYTTDFRGAYHVTYEVEAAKVTSPVATVSLSWTGGTPYRMFLWAAAFANGGGLGNAAHAGNEGANQVSLALTLSHTASSVMFLSNEIISDLLDECGVNGIDMNGTAKDWTHGPTGYQEYSYILGNTTAGTDPNPEYYFDYCVGNEHGGQGEIAPALTNRTAGYVYHVTMYPMRGFNGNHFFGAVEVVYAASPPPPPDTSWYGAAELLIMFAVCTTALIGAYKFKQWREGTL
jgi:hypothetical protein